MRSLYVQQPTWLHAVPASAKLATLAAAGTLLALVGRPAWLGAALAVVVLVFLSLGRVGWRHLGMLRGVLVACGLIAGFHWWLGTPWLGVATALRLANAALLALMLTLTTRFEDLLAVLERVLAPLRHFGLPVDRIALGLGLLLRFAEDFHAQWQRLDDAYRARTGRGGGLRLLAPLTIRALTTAERVADALAARLGK
ncbi:energy-coupling factor transporter transmembrane protein EcfT [Xylophilus sp. Kf1]|nr:energy-coupling factor transporter transmembrane protein EcfT [Xylophilus sp. Kf1]